MQSRKYCTRFRIIGTQKRLTLIWEASKPRYRRDFAIDKARSRKLIGLGIRAEYITKRDKDGWPFPVKTLIFEAFLT